GEGAWQPILERLRPGLRYVGVDPSPYAVARFGRRRNIRHGALVTLDRLRLRRRFDLVVCSDVLHYLPSEDIERGLRHALPLIGGVAYIETFTSSDGFVGDRKDFRARTPAFY